MMLTLCPAMMISVALYGMSVFWPMMKPLTVYNFVSHLDLWLR